MSIDISSGWSGTWAEFLAEDKTVFMQKLLDFYNRLPWTKDLSPSQHNSWIREYDIVRQLIDAVCFNTTISAEDCWVSFEQELIGEGGKRAADVNLVLPSGHLFVLEFKHKTSVSREEITRANFDLQTMLNFHSESQQLTGHCYLVLSRKDAETFNDARVKCEKITENDELIDLEEALISRLKEAACYDVIKWQSGVFYRQPSILHGTVQVFLDGKLPSLKTEAGENITNARDSLVKLYKHAKERSKRYIVLVHGKPGAGKTLLGISTVASLVTKYGADSCKPLFLSGNNPLVNVLTMTLDSEAKRRRVEENRSIVDGRSLIQKLVTFKSVIKRNIDDRNENFLVFDEAQRAWEKADPSNNNSESELALFCKWLSKKKFGVLVLLVGDGQAIHNNEMSLPDMLADLDASVAQFGGNIELLMPSEHKQFFETTKPIIRDRFFLKTPIRQAFTNELDQWIDAVLSNQADLAAKIASHMKQTYELHLCRSEQVANDFARNMQMALHEGNQKADAFRAGWLISSKTRNFKPEIPKKGDEVGHWYVDPPSSEKSCCQFKKACSEFSSQGLELSLALVNWGDDFVHDGDRLDESKDIKYKRDKSEYTFSTYRVLLSRGRSGLIVRCTNKKTYEYLVRCGMNELL